MVLCPPLDPAAVAAEFPLPSHSPFRLEFLPAIWTYPFGIRTLAPLLLELLMVIALPTLVTAKSPPPSWPLIPLLHWAATLWTDIDCYVIVSFGVIVPMPAGIAAKFLPRNMAGWYELLPTV